MTKPALMVLKGITKSFKNGQESLQVLKGIDLSVDEGDFVAIMGPSGSGKSTLMNIIGLLDQPTTGSYQLEGEDVAELSENRLAKVRNDQIGFIFQQFFLLPKLSAQKNVELPLIYAGKSPRERKQRAQQFLEKVGLSDRSIICRQSCLVDRSKGWLLRVHCLTIQQSFWRMNLRVRLIPRQEPRLWIS